MLRREKIRLRRNLAPDLRAGSDAAICRAVQSVLQSLSCHILTAYITDGTEPDLHPVLQSFLACRENRLYLPRFESDGCYRIVRAETLDFACSKWGIPEPSPDAPEAPEADLDRALWLVPGVAFDDTGMRLGRGKGIYDRLLSGGRRLSAGIFYECQRCETIPFEEHDRPLDLVITEKGIVYGADRIPSAVHAADNLS